MIATLLNSHGIPNSLERVPNPYIGWLSERYDITDGEYAGVRTERSLESQRNAINTYLSWNAEEFPDYANLVNTIMTHPHGDEDLGQCAGIEHIKRRSIEPMDERCRISVCIPAKGEQGQIRDALLTYAVQTTDKNGTPLAPSTYEFFVLVNTNTRDPLDRTYEEVMEFKRAHPQIRVSVCEVVIQNEWARIGFVRKLLYDLVLVRASQAQLRAPLYLHGNDADAMQADPQQLVTDTKVLDENPNLDAVVGYQEKYPSLLSQTEFIFMQQKVWNLNFIQGARYLEQQKVDLYGRAYRRRGPFFMVDNQKMRTVFEDSRVWMCGNSNTVTAEALALIGGYNWDMIVGEDLDIGKRISLLRGGYDDDGIFTPNIGTVRLVNTRTNGSPRRFVNGIAKQIQYVYSDEAFQDGRLREETLESMMRAVPPQYCRLTEASKGLFECELWHLYDELRRVIPDPVLARRIMSRSLSFLFEPGDVEITDTNDVHIHYIGNFSQRLEQYRQSQGVTIDALEQKRKEQRDWCDWELRRRAANGQ